MLILTLSCLCVMPHFLFAAILGVDVSHWQGTINWTDVKNSGVRFAIAKATEGKSYVDPTFITNWKGMRANNLQAGAYHFYHTDISNDDQISLIEDHIFNAVDFSKSSDYFVVDFEANSGNLSTTTASLRLNLFLESLREDYGVNTIVYTENSFWSRTVGTTYTLRNFETYPLWIAHYNSASSPTIPKPWTNYFIWQYTDTGKISGISGNCDLNRMG